jgi:hypothetical protein
VLDIIYIFFRICGFKEWLHLCSRVKPIFPKGILPFWEQFD